MHLNMLWAKWCPICLYYKVLITIDEVKYDPTTIHPFLLSMLKFLLEEKDGW